MARINENIGPILDALGSPGATDHTKNWRRVAEILDADGWDGESLAPDGYGAHTCDQRMAIDAAILAAQEPPDARRWRLTPSPRSWYHRSNRD